MAKIIARSKKIKYFHNVYEVEITDAGKHIKPITKNNVPCKSFSIPETTTNPKIYIVKFDNTIIYIGKTNQSISNRLRQGLNPRQGSGYYGYKWHNNNKIKIHCITIPLFNDTELETLEAELVYNCRFNTGK